MKRAFQGALWIIGGVALGIYLTVGQQGRPIYTRLEQVTPTRIAIVLGASVGPDGKPTVILFNRVRAAAELYRAGKVRQLLMSGTRHGAAYDEPAAMRALAIQMGVAPQDIQLDPNGFRTYDSLYRARDDFGVRQAVLVTQRSHLTRALYLARHLGIAAVGWEATTDSRGELLRWVYEAAARQLAWLDVHIDRRPRVL